MANKPPAESNPVKTAVTGDYSRWGPRIFLASTAIAIMVLWVIYATHPSRSNRPLALYKNFYAVGHPNFDEFSTGFVGDSRIAPIYLQTPEGRVIFLPQCTEADFEGLLERKVVSDGDVEYSEGDWPSKWSSFRFRAGRLLNASIQGDLVGWRIGVNQNGPFYLLPLDRQTLIKLFGKPLEWQRASRPSVA